MALQGSIKDFGLTDIFQLINLQKKTGTLTVQQGDTSATIHFEKGQIIYAALTGKGETDKKGKPHEEYVSEGDLKEALQREIKDVIFQILRWRDGRYRFDSQDIEYDGRYQIAMPVDFVLMEGIRMLDEWPYIEGIIPSKDIIFSQCYKEDETVALFSSLSPDELAILNLIDGKRDIRTIIDMTQLSEFEVFKTLSTLHVSGLISRTSLSKETEANVFTAEKEKGRLWNAIQIAMLTFIVSFILLLLPIREMARVNGIILSSDRLKKNAVERKLFYLHSAIRYYSMTNGVLPDSLELLQKERYLGRDFLTDPWGNLFVYEIGGFREDSSKTIETPYKVYSKGPDRLAGTQDDIF